MRDGARRGARFGALALAAAAATAAAAGASGVRRQAPAATLLYQNFPNPFPGTGVAAANAARAAGGSPATCVWFDLASPGTVRLEVFTLRGDRVRTIVPSAALGALLPAGRYGRADATGAGCDPRLTWDGTADDGRVVPAGVYLLRLAADRSTQIRKVVFRGR